MNRHGAAAKKEISCWALGRLQEKALGLGKKGKGGSPDKMLLPRTLHSANQV